MLKKIFKIFYLLFFILLTVGIWWFGYLRYSGNFHKVSSNIFRSGQLYSFNFPYYYNKYKFKTILNLRGAHNDKSWYKYEKNFAKEHNITLIDFGIDDKEVQSISIMNKIINIIQNAKKPILIHCKAGADRTGLATSLYLYYKHDKDYKNMLSLKYGHFPYFGSRTIAMDKSLEKYINNKKLNQAINLH